MNIYIAIACLLASVNADGPLGVEGLGGLVYAPGHASADYYSFPRYAFEYSVKDPHTGDNKAQWEKREGDVVKGAYSLVEPDGSLRVVEYYADDKSGFNAVVKRIGPNLHPTTVHAAPIYKAAIPVLGHGPIVSPISIGSVAKLGHLANAPLITGPVHGAVSSQSLYKSSVPVIKPLIQELGPILPPIQEPIPILPQPIIKSVPILGPIYKAGPIYSKPLGPPPYYKAPLPIYNEPLAIYKEPLPIYKEQLPIYKEQLPIYKEQLPIYKYPLPIYKESLPIYNEPLPLLKAPYGLGPVGNLEGINYGGIGPIRPWEGLNKGLGLNPYGPLHGIPKLPIGPGYGIIEKGPLQPGYEGPLDYSLINYKH